MSLIQVSDLLLGTSRGKSHLSGPVLLPAVRLALCRSPQCWPLTKSDPSVLVTEYVAEMTFKIFMVVFHALNSGLNFFIGFYLFILITGLNILLSEFKSLLSSFQILCISRCYLLPKMYFKPIYFMKSTI